MARAPKSIQVITANRLIDGRVVFLTTSGTWDVEVDAAEVFADTAAAQAGLDLGKIAVEAREIVEPYAIAVSRADGHITPLLLRERIRAEGPTIAADNRAA